ncbi:putative molybdenum cofactor guanylyltransferase [Maioricimonas rarisocia]|uniref:Putative molybdenum cofactor guanylyltransferase n=2 Tax=Maioricimonas rarisocia TaxID=2528026 RepID=A0A517Z8A3_9PLAN|nr:putative molybdenum cofactor guanylyltransferase [Maioricimonas rarisocia]
MGQPKLSLPFGSEVMLQRVVRLLGEVVSPVVVVAARDQELPELPDDVLVCRDEEEDLGPLAGLAVGLSALEEKVDRAFACGCDVPLLKPEFVRAVIDQLGDHDAAVPKEDDFYHPLAGIYRTSLVPRILTIVRERRLRPLFLIESVDAVDIPVESLRTVDPDLDSLVNTNTPEAYEAALQKAGVSAE